MCLGADKGNPTLSRRAGACSSRHERKRLGVGETVPGVFSCGITRRVRENKDRFDFNIRTDLGITPPDRADVNRMRLGGGRQRQLSVGTSATGHGLHLSARATGLKGTWSGESLEDDAERGVGGEGGMRSEGSTHYPVSIQEETFTNRGLHHGHGPKIYNILIGDGQTFSGIDGAFVAEIGYHSISVFATHPGRYLLGWVDRFELCYYYCTHIHKLWVHGEGAGGLGLCCMLCCTRCHVLL